MVVDSKKGYFILILNKNGLNLLNILFSRNCKGEL